MQATITFKRTAASIFTTPNGTYSVLPLTAEDGYRTYRIQHNPSGAWGVVCTIREARESIAAHIASHGRTWNAHLVPSA
jgi:hypothetical protein